MCYNDIFIALKAKPFLHNVSTPVVLHRIGWKQKDVFHTLFGYFGLQYLLICSSVG